MVTCQLFGNVIIYMWTIRVGSRMYEHGLVAKLDDRRHVAAMVRRNRQEMRAIMAAQLTILGE